jgi:hypothetical protein
MAARDTLTLGLRGFWAVLDGHLGHARLANRMIYWLRRSSPTCLAQNDPEIRVLMKHPGSIGARGCDPTPMPRPE